MTIRTRKFLGTIGTLAWLGTYCLIAMAIGGIYVVGRGPVFELPYYVLAGLGWIPGAMIIIRWMSKPDAS
jgi:Protein of unknown function (DUF2842)